MKVIAMNQRTYQKYAHLCPDIAVEVVSWVPDGYSVAYDPDDMSGIAPHVWTRRERAIEAIWSVVPWPTRRYWWSVRDTIDDIRCGLWDRWRWQQERWDDWRGKP